MRKQEQRSIRLCCVWERFLKDKGKHFINSYRLSAVQRQLKWRSAVLGDTGFALEE